MGLEMDCLTSRILLQKACNYTCQFFITKYVTFKAGLSGSYDGLEKYKEEVADVSNPNQNVETPCNSKLKFT